MYPCETSQKPDTYKHQNNRLKIIFSLVIILLFQSLAFAADSVKVIVKNQQAKASSIYEVEFVASKPISPKATIVINFPEAFDLSNLQVAGSSTLNGGFNLKVENKELRLERSGLGREISPNEKVSVKFAIVKNPDRAGDEYNLEIEILNDQKQSIFSKEEKVSILPERD